MRGILSFCLLAFLCPSLSAQNVYTIKADSVKITNCDSSELIIENHTQGVPGFLYNTGNGRTIFKRGLVNLGNGFFQIGGDTLKAWMQGGNSFGTIGVLGTLDNNHLDLYTNNTQRARLTNGGHLLIGTTTDNGQTLQVFGNGYFGGNVGFGQTSPVAPIDILQSLSGSSASSAINVTSTLNTTGAPSLFKMNVTNTASGAGSNLFTIAQDGVSRLTIPVGAGQTTFYPNGVMLRGPSGGSGGISLGGATPVSNSIYTGGGTFLINNPSSLTGAGYNSFSFNPGAAIQFTSGTASGLNIPGTFNPSSGTASYAHLSLNPTINQTGGASGITWGLYIAPVLTSASNFRALEVVSGNSYFGTTSGNMLLGTTTDNGHRLQTNGNIYTSGYLTNSTTALGNASTGGSLRFKWGTGDGMYMSFYNSANNQRSYFLSAADNRPLRLFDSVGISLYSSPYLAIGTEFSQNAKLSVVNQMGSSLYDLVAGRLSVDTFYYDFLVQPPGTTNYAEFVDHGAVTQINGRTAIAGNVGIGILSPTAQLHTTGTVRFAGLTQDSTQTRVIVSDASGNLYYRSASSIAIDEPLRSSLAINGTIKAKQLRLQPEGWADYVFDKTYRLPALAEIEAYIRENHHLPGIIPADEVLRNGVDVGEIQTTLLRKIEELTLYTIDQDKKLTDQQKELDSLKAKMEKLEQLLDSKSKTGN